MTTNPFQDYPPLDDPIKRSTALPFCFKGFLAIGIASVARPAGEMYLLQTTQSLLDNTSQSDKDSVQIVIFLADLEKAPRSAVKEKLSRKFGEHIEQGLLTVIETFPEFYPELINIKEKYGDSENRRTWRSKENVDNAFVMCYCKDFSQYYIHLEDDVRSSPSFLPKLKNFIHDQPYPNWVMLDVAQQGSVAKLYQSRDLENAAMFYYLLYDEMPIDWLMNHWTKIKSVEDAESFNKLLASLFEHIGVTSTLAEKAPHVASDLETFFDAYDQKYKGLNPPAIVTSSMSSIEGQPQDAYDKGDGYFWAESSERDDYILIKFNLPTSVQKVFVDTGSYRASDCLLYSGILQASFESSVDGELTNEEDSCGYFNTIGAFHEGKAEITPDESKVVTCLRIVSTEGHANQIFFREIDVWESLTNNKADV